MADASNFEHFKRSSRLLAGAIAMSIVAIPYAFAQGGQTEVTKTVPSAPAQPAPVAPAPVPDAKTVSPIGAGPSWQAGVAPAQPAPQDTQQSDLEVVTKINDYFNKLSALRGTFIQTDPDNRRKEGRFFFQRPGKVRFDYTAPADLKVISDGRYLAIEDYSMNTSEKYPLDVTPFKLLLSETVDLARDARILGVEQGPDTIILTVEDKNSDTAGRIRLFFNKADMSLKQWIITDAQGLDTRIEVSNLEENKVVADNYFHISATLGLDHDR
ncbi:MAG: outer-membrane lipoprotein carrier protein LolA [Rhodomicrobium sp.]